MSDVWTILIGVGLGVGAALLAQLTMATFRPLAALYRRRRVVLSAAATLPARDRAHLQDDESSAMPGSEDVSTRSVPDIGILRTVSTGDRFYVTRVEMENFRCFARARLDLRVPGESSELRYPNVNLLLGNNGSGKSSVLRAIAQAALGPALNSSGFAPYHLVRVGQGIARVRGEFVWSDPSRHLRVLPGTVAIQRHGDFERLHSFHDEEIWSALFDESDPSFLVVGYGANRRVAGERARVSLEQGKLRRRYQRVASLFDEEAVLVPLGSWLPGLPPRRRDEVLKLLTKSLPTGTLVSDSTDGDDVTFVHHGVPLPYRAMSDGYRSFIGWVSDLLFQVTSVIDERTPIGDVGGIVLVDEVDLLLHPTWQREVIGHVARLFPHMQFVFTTHSPLVASTLEADNIALAWEEDGLSRLQRPGAAIHGLNAEQVLRSPYFRMRTTRAPDVDNPLEVLARRAVRGDSEAATEYLRRLAAGDEQLDRP